MSLRTHRNRRLITALLLATTVPLTGAAGTATAATSTGDVEGGRYVSGVVHLHVGDVDALVDRG